MRSTRKAIGIALFGCSLLEALSIAATMLLWITSRWGLASGAPVFPTSPLDRAWDWQVGELVSVVLLYAAIQVFPEETRAG